MMISPVFLLAGLGAVSRGLLWRQPRLPPRQPDRNGRAGARRRRPRSALAVAGLDAEAIVLGALVGALVDRGPAADRGAAAAAALAPRGAARSHRLRPARLGRRPHLRGDQQRHPRGRRGAPLAAQVGLFWRAFQLGVVYQEKISGIMMRLAFPVYSRTTDLDELRRFHERATRIHAAVLLPLLSLLIVTAPDLVPWVFGERWAPAVGAGPDPRRGRDDRRGPHRLPADHARRRQAAGAAGLQPRPARALRRSAPGSRRPTGSRPWRSRVVGVHVALLVAVYGVLFRRVLGIPIGRLVTDLLPAVACSLLLLAVAAAGGGPAARPRRPVPVLLARGTGVAGGAVYLAPCAASSPPSGTTSPS